MPAITAEKRRRYRRTMLTWIAQGYPWKPEGVLALHALKAINEGEEAPWIDAAYELCRQVED